MQILEILQPLPLLSFLPSTEGTASFSIATSFILESATTSSYGEWFHIYQMDTD